MTIFRTLWTTTKAHPVFLGGLLVGAIAFGGAVATDEKGLFGPVTAAWVQAIFSVAAISAGFHQANRSEQRARRATVDAWRHQLELLLHTGAMAQHFCRAMLRCVEGIDRQPILANNFDAVLATLNELRIADMPAGNGPIALMNMRKAVPHFQALFAAWSRGKIATIYDTREEIFNPSAVRGDLRGPTAIELRATAQEIDLILQMIADEAVIWADR